MHFLDRSKVPVPECLVAPPEDRTYKNLDGQEKAEIRKALLTLQLYRCAYCERRTGDHKLIDGHIEHFRDQSGHHGLTLDWGNLFWSCNDERTCGKHKDKCRKQHGDQRLFVANDLIDPSVEDPERYLLLVSDGTVTPRSGLNEDERRRAGETIRVFQLNESAYLVRSRHDAIRPYMDFAATLFALGSDAFRQYVAGELQRSASSPFGTAIKHFLTNTP